GHCQYIAGRFWSHEPQCIPGIGCHGRLDAGSASCGFGGPEGAAVVRADEQIPRVDVAVDDTLEVQVRECLERTHDEHARFVEQHWLSACGETVEQTLATQFGLEPHTSIVLQRADAAVRNEPFVLPGLA